MELSPGSVKKAMPVGGATGVLYCPAADGGRRKSREVLLSAGEAMDGERLAEAEMIAAGEESSISRMLYRFDRNAVREESTATA